VSIGIAFLLSTAPMSGNYFVILSFQEISRNDRQEVFACDELASESPNHLFIFLGSKNH
jgi:hypothetical protein